MWVIITVLLLLAATGLVYGSWPMKIIRHPEREGEQKGDAVFAYDRTSRWPIFILERKIIMWRLGKKPLSGLLLDLGSGPGYLATQISRYHPGLTVKGVDINDDMLGIAGQKWSPNLLPRVEFLQGDVHELPFRDNSADYIVSSLSLHHWLDAQKAFSGMYRVLKPGGQFLVFDLRRDSCRWFYWALKVGQIFSPEAIRRTNGAVGSFWASYTISETKAVIRQTLFRDWKIESGFGWMVISGCK
jgi:ubiquinone/menaquinone biosynthesis C-methylase UbiE